MKFSKKDRNQVRLYNACEHVVESEWGFLVESMQDLIVKYVEQYIQNHLD